MIFMHKNVRRIEFFLLKKSVCETERGFKIRRKNIFLPEKYFFTPCYAPGLGENRDIQFDCDLGKDFGPKVWALFALDMSGKAEFGKEFD